MPNMTRRSLGSRGGKEENPQKSEEAERAESAQDADNVSSTRLPQAVSPSAPPSRDDELQSAVPPPPPGSLNLWGASATSPSKCLGEEGVRRRQGSKQAVGRQSSSRSPTSPPRIPPKRSKRTSVYLTVGLLLLSVFYGIFTFLPPYSTHTSAPPSVRAEYRDVLWPTAMFNFGQWLLDLMESSVRALTPAHLHLLRLGGRWMESVAAHLLVRLHVCDIIGDRSQWMSSDELIQEILKIESNITSIERDRLERLLLTGVELGLLKKKVRRADTSDPSGQATPVHEFSLTSLGTYLKKDHPKSARPFLYFLSGLEGMSAFHSLFEAVQSGKSGFKEIYGEEKFEHMTKHHSDWTIFDEAQASLNRDSLPAILGEYGLQKSTETAETAEFTFCDIGGGIGITLAEVLRAYPRAKGILLDRSQPVATAQERLNKLGLGDRGRAVVGDFFKPFPADFEECDYYHMRWILHDWGDEKSWAILNSIKDSARSKLARGKRFKIVIAEAVLGTQPTIMELNKRLMDLSMMAWHESAKERSLAEYDALFEHVGFVRTAYVPTQSILGVIEYSPESRLYGPERGE